MIKNTLLFAILMLPAFYVQAQTNSTIIGIVVELETQEPMQYVNVALLDETDSTLIAGTVTDDEGEFEFLDVESKQYRIKMSFIGFEDVEMSYFAPPGEHEIGLIPIKRLAILIDEVEVTAEKSILVSTVDKKIYSVGKDIISESGSVTDILQNIPSVSVDLNGKITLRGTSNITFLINGRPSPVFRRNASQVLQQMSATTIDRIEVITNPSAKYNPEGAGGIINIVQRKDSEQGVNAEIIANVGNEKRYNATLILNYGTDKFNTFGSYSLRHPSVTTIFSDKRTIKDSISGVPLSFYNESGSTESDPLGHVFNAGMTYQFDDKNFAEISGNYFLQNSLHEGVSDINEVDNQNQPINQFKSVNANDELESEGEVGAAYEHIFGDNEEHNIAIEAVYGGYYEREFLTFEEFYTVPDIDNDKKDIKIQKDGDAVELVLDYALPVGADAEIETGYAGEIVNDNIFYQNDLLLNKFLFNQNVHALYLMYGQDIQDFNFQLGLRAEKVWINSHIVEPIDSLIENDYFKLYPSLQLAYDFNENENIHLSYSKRVNRPDADQLNPFVEFIDPRNGVAGNAELLPEQIHSFEFGYQMFGESITFTPTLYYRYTYDAFTSVSNIIGDSLVISTVENLSNKQAGGLELILSGNVFSWWDYDLSTNLFYNEINSDNLGYAKNKNNFSGTGQLYSLFEITGTTFLQLNLFYNSPVLLPQGESNETFYVNAGLKQMLFDKQVALTFTVTDIFRTYEEGWKINSFEFNQAAKLYRDEPVFYLGFSWRIGGSTKSESDLEFEETGLKKL